MPLPVSAISIAIMLKPAAFVALGSDGQHAAAVHGVASVRGDVEQRGLQLRPVGLDRADLRRKLHDHRHALADRAFDQLAHVGDQDVDVDLFRHERLAAREREQLRGQRCRVGRRLHDRLGESDPLRLGQFRPAQHVGRALNDGQQIIEVVGDAAGELAERLHLLALAQLLLGLGPFLHLLFEQFVGAAECFRSTAKLAIGAAELDLGQTNGRDDECRKQE